MEKLKVYLRFETLIAELFAANGFRVDEHDVLSSSDKGYDFESAKEGDLFLVEVKYYRTARAQIGLIESAATRLLTTLNNRPTYKGILVLSCELNSRMRHSLENKFGLIFVDRVDLLTWATKSPELADSLNSFLDDEGEVPQWKRGRSASESIRNRYFPHLPLPPQDDQGSILCAELRALRRGRNSWPAYEKLCERILKYLFPNDLHGWHSQKRTDDGLNRFDYVCRIKPSTDFWRFLIDHLNSRYVLFEFKNYSGGVKQGQILTTEKYLLEKGLRRVAIVFTRKGAKNDAIKMAQGAMREDGKLILILDDEKVCEMLHMKERGDDPTDLLFDCADEFLLALPR